MNFRFVLVLLILLCQIPCFSAEQQQGEKRSLNDKTIRKSDSKAGAEVESIEEEKSEYDQFIKKPKKDPMQAEPKASTSFDLEYFKSTFGTLPGIMVVIGGVVIFALLLRLIGGFVFEER